MSASTRVERGFTIVRELDAPRELVFRAWTEPEHLQQWFATTPGAADNPTTVDLRVGGAWRLLMVEHADKSYVTGGIYHEIVEPERLAYWWGAVDGWPSIDPDRPEDNPLFTVILNAVGRRTEMITTVGFVEGADEDRVREWLATGMRDGWTQTVDRLAPYLVTAAR
jgi:uncharacterized protein YndB with AHSA1/START domain